MPAIARSVIRAIRRRSLQGKSPPGKNTRLIKTSPAQIRDKNGREFLRHGARLVSVLFPDVNKRQQDLIWGYDTLAEYQTPRDSLGAVIGRYAGKIAGGWIRVDGAVFHLVQNSNAHTMHGGIGTGACYAEKLWTMADFTDMPEPSLYLTLLSPNGEGGFPGNLAVRLRYTVTGGNALRIEYTLRSDMTTVTNLTSHAFFNLEGLESSSILDHLLQINADEYTITDENDIPTGDTASVHHTPLDFSVFKAIRKDISRLPQGYNHNYILACTADQPAADLFAQGSGIGMRVWTDQPGLQLYTAGRMVPGKTGKGGKAMRPQGAVCLETQHFPDSPHHVAFPGTVLKAGVTQKSITTYQFYHQKS